MATLRDLGAGRDRRCAPRPRSLAAAVPAARGDPRVAAVRAGLPLRRGRRHGAARRRAPAIAGRRAAPRPAVARRRRPGRGLAGRRARRRRERAASTTSTRLRRPARPARGTSRRPQAAASCRCRSRASERPYGFLVAGLNRYRAARRRRTAAFVDLVAGQVAARIGDRPRLRGRAPPGRAARRARPGQDRVLHQRQPRVPHAADAAARPGRGRAGRRRPRRCPPRQRERVEVVHRNAQRLLKLVNTLLDFSRLESGRVDGALRAGRPRRATPPSSPSMFRVGGSSGPASTLDVDCPPLPEPVYVDREHVGEDRAQPALQRAEVHVRGRRSRSALDATPTARPRLERHRHRHRDRAGRAGAACSSASTGCSAPARAPTRARASAWRWSPSWPRCTAATVGVESAPGGAARSRSRLPLGTRRTCPPTRSCRRGGGRRRRRVAAGARRGLPRRGAALARARRRTPRRRRRRGRRRRRRAPGRASWSSTTTPTCATTSPPLLARRLRRRRRPPTARPRSRCVRDDAARPRPHRRDDARARRLRPARARCAPTPTRATSRS